MRQVIVNVFSYDELSEKAKEKALDKLSDINCSDSFWYECILDEAKDLGLKIDSFDTYRGNYIKGNFTDTAENIAKRIVDNHGECCGTFQIAQAFIEDMKHNISLNTPSLDNGEFKKSFIEFERALLEEYLIMLRKELEYCQSREAIEETIRANEYMFTEDGTLF